MQVLLPSRVGVGLCTLGKMTIATASIKYNKGKRIKNVDFQTWV
jgi:hypothetical protein